jgi:HlyD family secretion protein
VRNENARQKQLFEREVISREEMEQSDVALGRAVEEAENARDNLEIVRDGISRRSAQMSNTQIRSTISGMILDIPVRVGNSVIQSNTFNDGTTIATVADMGDMIFIGTIDETEVGRVHTGMPVSLKIGALENREFDATLEYISPKATEQNGAILFEIRAAAVIPDSVVVRAGYSANAEIVLARADSVLTLPEATLTFRGDSTFVNMLVDSLASPQVFSERQVGIGISNGIDVEIVSGVAEGDRVRGGEKRK